MHSGRLRSMRVCAVMLVAALGCRVGEASHPGPVLGALAGPPEFQAQRRFVGARPNMVYTGCSRHRVLAGHG